MLRRAFLRSSAAASASLLLPGCRASPLRPDAVAVDATGPADAAGCRPTTADVQGPFFLEGAPHRIQIADPLEPGERLLLGGVLLAADCATPLAGAAIEVWQADRDGNYHDAADGYRLRGKVTTDASGRFEVHTIRPGNYTLAAGVWRPAHVHFTFAAAGHRALTTQLYFAGDPFLPPNDGCAGCGSDDPDRILALAGDASAGWTAETTIVLAAA